jgi:hypothetical protein
MNEELKELLTSQVNEELSKLNKPEEKVIEEVTASVEPSDDSDPFLEEAIKSGFDPKYDGPNKKTAEQFVKDGSYYAKIAAQNKKIDELKNLVQQSLNHSTKLEKAAYDKALNDLKRDRDRAVLEADLNKVHALDAEYQIKSKEIAPINERLAEADQPQITQDLLDFQERNKDWFNNQSDENAEMVEAADFIDKRIALQLRQQGKTISQGEHLKLVEEKIQKLYRHRFVNENQEKPSLTTKSTVGTSGKSSEDKLVGRLTERQLQFVKQARTYGSKLTNAEYARQLQVTGDLRDE